MSRAHPTPPTQGPAPALDASSLVLLREHAALRRALTDLLREGTAPGSPASESRVADALDAVVADADLMASELQRRGIPRDAAESAFATETGASQGLELRDAIAHAFPYGTESPAFRAWTQRADAGSTSAQYVVGMMRLLTAEREDDAKSALALLERAADGGCGPAIVAAARFHPEPLRGLARLRRAAEAGHPGAAFSLALLAQSGAPIGLSVGEVIELLETAAAAGNPEAQVELGRIHASGALGFALVDHAKAKHWLTLAAARHRAIAQEWLDQCGDVPPREYRNRMWLEAWTPGEVPPPARSGPVGLLVSIALFVLLAVAAASGSDVGVFVAIGFTAVLLHELGHLLAARWAGIPIAVFAVGAGPVVRSFCIRRGPWPLRVDLRLLPLLGYVQPDVVPRGIWSHLNERARCEAAGEPPPPLPDFDAEEEPDTAAHHVSHPKRAVFLLGGLAMNFVAAVLFLWLYETKSPVTNVVTAPEAGPVAETSLAHRSGIREGDRFVSVAGEPVQGFFDVRDRLAPLADDGTAETPPHRPGESVEVVVLRDGNELRLHWLVPSLPPATDAETAYGLVPPRTWIVESRSPRLRPEVEIGDEIVGFRAGGREVAAGEPGAHEALRAAFRSGPVPVRLRRAGREMQVDVDPWKEGARVAPRAPFEFARKRETVERTGLLDAVGETVTIGVESVLALPRTMLSAVTSTPSREEQQWVLAAVARDPWRVAHLVGWFHAFLLALNFLPVPPLDGFEFLRLTIETVRGRPLPAGGLGTVRKAGWALMAVWIALNAFLLVRDAILAI